MISIFTVMLAALVWIWYLLETEPNPILITLLAVAIAVYSVYKIENLRDRLKSLRLGRDGEKIVGQYLEELREKGYRIFHDIVGDGFNIDHVILSTGGIFSVKTKTFGKPAKGKPEIIYEGREVPVDGYEPERDIVSQAAAQRNWLGELLKVQASIIPSEVSSCFLDGMLSQKALPAKEIFGCLIQKPCHISSRTRC